MWYVWDRRETHTGFWWGNLKEKVYLEDRVLDVKVML
jgi:hypothetical protein